MTSRRMLLEGLAAALSLNALPVAAAALDPEDFSQVYDVIVVGGGGAGLAAAVSAAETKARVCLIEKLSVLGSDTLRSTGYFSCVEPRRQKLNGVVDSLDLHFQQTMTAGQNLGNPSVVRTMINEAPRTVSWLEECGVIFQDAVYEIYGADYRRCLKPLLPRGTAYVRALSERAMKLGVRILTATKLTDLHFDSDGRAFGISAVNDAGLVLRLGARRGIVLASGGFGSNAAMVAQYAPELAGLPTDNSPGSTGDVVALAQKYDIGLEGLSYVECVAGNPPGRKTHARLFIPSDFILVNEEGRRFVEEDALRMDLTRAILQQPNRRCFTVFDNQGVSHLDPISQKGLYQALVADEALSAATISELAALMQVPIENFKKEIERYNRAALGQKPADSKSSRAISKCSRIGCTELTEPPFWAYEVGLTVHYTLGGISINENAQVLAADGKVIEGLWAAGEVTGSVHGANRLGGNGLTDAFTFGRLAGATVAQRD